MMKTKNNYILVFISSIILITICIQVYWNLKNYEENKKRLYQEIQLAFDNSVTNYYLTDLRNDHVVFINQNPSINESDFINNLIKSALFKKEVSNSKSTASDTLKKSKINLSVSYDVSEDSIVQKHSSLGKTKAKTKRYKLEKIKVLKGIKNVDSISSLKNQKNILSFSTIRDSIDFKKLSTSLNKELKKKNLKLSYKIVHYKSEIPFDKFQNDNSTFFPLMVTTNSRYVIKNQQLELYFSNPSFVILKYGLTGILLSFILSLSIISCLVYLLFIINKQKKIDQVKNDLISNITHEFKTPITTVATALEGIKYFNTENDFEKTNRYLEISQNQLKKLEILVEKLLETAYLENEQLELEKEKKDIVSITSALVSNFQQSNSNKKFVFNSNKESIEHYVDSFHFENAISNLIDNAQKYGGNIIEISVIQTYNQLKIAVSDNGFGIAKKNIPYLFDKFFREQSGNIHTIKGFGIGLFYTKKIIEKHGGLIKVDSNNNKKTTFTVYLNEGK